MGTVYTATVGPNGEIFGSSYDSQQSFHQTHNGSFNPEPMTISDEINGIIQIGGMKVDKADLDAGYFGNELKEAYYAQQNEHQSVPKKSNHVPTQSQNVDVHDENQENELPVDNEESNHVDIGEFPEDYVSHVGFDTEEMHELFDQTQILGAEGFDNLVGEVAEALASGGDGEIQISDEYADKLTEAGFTTASMSTQVDSAVSRIDSYIANNYDFSDEKWSALHLAVWNDPTLMKEIGVETFSDKTDTLDEFLKHLGFTKK